jgi:hypothetical protein
MWEDGWELTNGKDYVPYMVGSYDLRFGLTLDLQCSHGSEKKRQ